MINFTLPFCFERKRFTFQGSDALARIAYATGDRQDNKMDGSRPRFLEYCHIENSLATNSGSAAKANRIEKWMRVTFTRLSVLRVAGKCCTRIVRASAAIVRTPLIMAMLIMCDKTVSQITNQSGTNLLAENCWHLLPCYFINCSDAFFILGKSKILRSVFQRLAPKTFIMKERLRPEFQDQNTSRKCLSSKQFARTFFDQTYRQRLKYSFIAFLLVIAFLGRESWVSYWAFRSCFWTTWSIFFPHVFYGFRLWWVKRMQRTVIRAIKSTGSGLHRFAKIVLTIAVIVIQGEIFVFYYECHSLTSCSLCIILNINLWCSLRLRFKLQDNDACDRPGKWILMEI